MMYPGTCTEILVPNIWCPKLSQERVNYKLQIWPEHSQAQSEQKRIKNFGQGGMGVTRDWPANFGTANFVCTFI